MKKSHSHCCLDAARLWADIEDHLVPAFALSPVDRVIYLSLLRTTRLRGRKSVWTSGPEIGRSTMLTGSTVRKSFRRLAQTGAVRIVNSGNHGLHIQVRLPHEIPECLRHAAVNPYRDIESINFLSLHHWRRAIYRREGGRCFYCRQPLNNRNRVFDHVVPRIRGGNDSYRNLVASCAHCNCAKRGRKANDFLRSLRRQRILTGSQFEGRRNALRQLKAGKLKPHI